MSTDNLDSTKVPHVVSGKLPELGSLGITVSALQSIAQACLQGW